MTTIISVTTVMFLAAFAIGLSSIFLVYSVRCREGAP